MDYKLEEKRKEERLAAEKKQERLIDDIREETRQLKKERKEA